MVSFNIRNPGAAQVPSSSGNPSASDSSSAAAVQTAKQDIGVMSIRIAKTVEEFRPMELFKVGTNGNSCTAVLGIANDCLVAGIPNASSGDYFLGPIDTGSRELQEAFMQECKRIVANGKNAFA